MCVCGYVGTSHEFMGFEFRRGSLQSALDLTETAAHRNRAAVSVPRSWQLAVELCLKLHSKLRCFLTEFALFSEHWVSDPSIASRVCGKRVCKQGCRRFPRSQVLIQE